MATGVTATLNREGTEELAVSSGGSHDTSLVHLIVSFNSTWERADYPCWLPRRHMVKNLPANAGDIRDATLIPGLGRDLGVGHGNPLQYSCLENSMDRGAWRATVHVVTKSRSWLSTHSNRWEWWGLRSGTGKQNGEWGCHGPWWVLRRAEESWHLSHKWPLRRSRWGPACRTGLKNTSGGPGQGKNPQKNTTTVTIWSSFQRIFPECLLCTKHCPYVIFNIRSSQLHTWTVLARDLVGCFLYFYFHFSWYTDLSQEFFTYLKSNFGKHVFFVFSKLKYCF